MGAPMLTSAINVGAACAHDHKCGFLFRSMKLVSRCCCM